MKHLQKATLVVSLLPALFALSGCGSSKDSVSPTVTASGPVAQAALVAVVSPSTITTNQTATLTTTGGSGSGAVSFNVTTGSCTVSGTTLTAPATAGTCSVTATKVADSSYLVATSTAVNVTVNAPGNTISFSAPSSPTVGGATVSLGATATSGLPVSYASQTTGVCTVTGSSVTPVTDGTCTIVASQAGDSSFPAAIPVSVSFSVNGEAQTITFTAPTAPTAGNTASLSATASSGLTVGFAASPSTVCTVSGTTLTAVNTGSCMITASQTGNSTYAAAGSVTHTISINGAAPAQLIYSGGFSASANLAPSPVLTLTTAGQFGGYAGSDEDGYSCNTSWCGGGAFDAGTPATSSAYFYYQPPAPATGEYVGFFIQAPGVTAISATGNTSGMQINGQTSISFTLNQNQEWFNQTNHNVLVQLTLGNLYGTCNVLLRDVFTPTSVSATAYTLLLSDFTVAQSCGMGALTPTSPIAALAANTGGPIVQLDFQGDSGASALTAGAAALTSSANITNANGSGVYPTTIVVTGLITFQ